MNQYPIKKMGFVLTLLLAITLLVSCRNTPQPDCITKSSFYLNTIVTITIYDSLDETLIDNSFALCEKYETMFSSTKAESPLYQLNHGTLPMNSSGEFTLPNETTKLIALGLHYGELSQGGFDISISPLSTLWDFSNTSPVVPTISEIAATRSLVNYKNILLEHNRLTFLSPNMGIDLGGIAKGYIADRIKDYLLSQGVRSAIINLGGNVLCIGNKPSTEGFYVGIQKPFANRSETIATMNITDKSIVSSGIYERFFEKDGKLYHHMINPKTGYPFDNNLISVTIVSTESVIGDALSTACFSLGLEQGLVLAQQEGVDAIFITSDYKMHYTPHFKELYDVS